MVLTKPLKEICDMNFQKQQQIYWESNPIPLETYFPGDDLLTKSIRISPYRFDKVRTRKEQVPPPCPAMIPLLLDESF